MNFEASKRLVFQSVEGQSPVTPPLPKSTIGTHPETGAPVSVILGGARPTVQDHLPTGEASRALQQALAKTPREPEQRNVTRTAPHSALSITPVGNNGPHPSSPSPSPSPSPSAGDVADALPPGERKGGDGNEVDKNVSVGNFEEARKAQEVEIARAEKLISSSDVFRDFRLALMVADSPAYLMEYASSHRADLRDLFDQLRDEVPPQLIATSIADVFLNQTRFYGPEKIALRTELAQLLETCAIAPTEISDWNTAKEVFIDKINVLYTDKFRIDIIDDQISKFKIAGLSAHEVAFVPEPRRINPCLAQLHAEVESNGVVSGEYIESIAEFTIDYVRDRYEELFADAFDAVENLNELRLANKEESIEILKYLVHRGCDPSCSNRYAHTFFGNEIDNLFELDKEQRASQIHSVLKTGLQGKYAPSALIESMHNIPGNGAKQKIIRVYDRCFVAMKFGGVIVPFYLSSGLSPKEGIAPGKWYPFFGVGRDHDWINKDTEMMANYYNSPKLTKIAKLLDDDFGDLREDGSIEEMKGFSEEVRELLNSDMREADFIFDETGTPVVDEEGVNYVTNDFLAPSISALTALIDASNTDDRIAAATDLAALDLAFRKNVGPAESFIQTRFEHYLTVGDPIAISSEQTAASPERKESNAQ